MATNKEVEQAKEYFEDAAYDLHALAYELYEDRDWIFSSKANLEKVPATVDKMRNHLQAILMTAQFLRQELDK